MTPFTAGNMSIRLRRTVQALGAAFVALAVGQALANRASTLPSPAPTPATQGSETTVGAVRGGLPVIDEKKMGSLPLDKLPVGPDGQKMVAMVNGNPITEKRFLSALKKAASSMPGGGNRQSEGKMAAFANPIMDKLVTAELYRDYAQKRKLSVTEQEIDRAIEAVNRRRTAGRKLQDEAFAMGRTMADVREDVLDELIEQKVEEFFEDQFTTGTPTNEEIREFLKQSNAPTTGGIELRASHIVFRAKPDMTPEQIEDAKARADRVLELIRGGLSFADAARQNSQDRHTVSKGGDLGYFSAGSMFPEFEKAALALKVGEVSAVVRTPVGFHIIKVTERNADNAHGLWLGAEKAKALARFREDLHARAKIEKFI